MIRLVTATIFAFSISCHTRAPEAPPPPPPPCTSCACNPALCSAPPPRPIDDLPAPPTRDQALSIQETFQGLTVHTRQYGDLPWFDCAVSSLSAEDRKALYEAKHAAGDTHLGICLSWLYAEPGQPYANVLGRDLSIDLGTFRALVEEGIRNGFVVMPFLAGDGESNPNGGYNNPAGWTYGYAWLIHHWPAIVGALRGPPDLTPYCVFVPGFDGVFDGWTPDQVVAFGAAFRAQLPSGHLALEHNTGNIPIGNGPSDYGAGRPLQDYDAILSEFTWPPTGEVVWQIAGRLLGPAYHRAPDEPSTDDPGPPCYLCTPTARGPYYAIAFEYAEYQWVRGQVTATQLATARTYLRNLGYRCVN